MKKRLLMLTLIGALGCTALCACGKEEEPSSSKEKREKEADEDEEVESKKNEKLKGEDPVEEEPAEVDEEDYAAVMAPLLGEWVYAEDDLDPMYLTVYSEAGMYYYDLEDMSVLGSTSGTVDLYSEEHPDGSISLWYRFVDVDGNEWEYFAVDEDDPYPNDIYSGQDGALHFVRYDSNAVQTEPGMGDVQGYFFLGNWEAPGYTMEVLDNGNDSYFVTISTSEISNNAFQQWEYICNFDEENEFLFSDNGELIVLEMENGEVSSKHSEYADGSAIFYFENGGIVWGDYEDQSHQDLVFEYVSE